MINRKLHVLSRASGLPKVGCKLDRVLDTSAVLMSHGVSMLNDDTLYSPVPHDSPEAVASFVSCEDGDVPLLPIPSSTPKTAASVEQVIVTNHEGKSSCNFSNQILTSSQNLRYLLRMTGRRRTHDLHQLIFWRNGYH